MQSEEERDLLQKIVQKRRVLALHKDLAGLEIEENLLNLAQAGCVREVSMNANKAAKAAANIIAEGAEASTAHSYVAHSDILPNSRSSMADLNDAPAMPWQHVTIEEVKAQIEPFSGDDSVGVEQWIDNAARFFPVGSRHAERISQNMGTEPTIHRLACIQPSTHQRIPSQHHDVECVRAVGGTQLSSYLRIAQRSEIT